MCVLLYLELKQESYRFLPWGNWPRNGADFRLSEMASSSARQARHRNGSYHISHTWERVLSTWLTCVGSRGLEKTPLHSRSLGERHAFSFECLCLSSGSGDADGRESTGERWVSWWVFKRQKVTTHWKIYYGNLLYSTYHNIPQYLMQVSTMKFTKKTVLYKTIYCVLYVSYCSSN